MIRFAQRLPAKGFTLLELMVVLVLIGIVLTFAVTALRSPGDHEQLKQEALRVRALVGLASDEAVMQVRTYGVILHDDGYQFAVHGGDGWRTVRDRPLQARELPPTMRISTPGRSTVDQPADSDPTPQILLFADGSFTPFELELVNSASGAEQRLQGTEDGEIRLQAP